MNNKILLSLAVVVLVIAVVAGVFTYYSIADLAAKVSGFATGEANLTVETAATINFTTSTINWQSGLVSAGQSKAYLDTLIGTVVNGNWTAVSTPLAIENIGNVNVTLNMSAGKTAATFIGGTSPLYLWNVSASEASSCLLSNGSAAANPGRVAWGFYGAPNTTTELVCGKFQFRDSADRIIVHFNLTVPSDSFTGALGDVITATAFACSC